MNIDRDSAGCITERIIGCAFTVANTLGAGFLEKVYENALALELREAGLSVAQQHQARVNYKGVTVGLYTADMLVENAVVVELRAVCALTGVHRAQCINCLKATGVPLCLLINFGRPRTEIKRIVV